MANRTSPLAGLRQARAWASSKGWGMSLVIEATAQSPARRANSRASERWKGRKSRRWVLIVNMRPACICARPELGASPAKPAATSPGRASGAPTWALFGGTFGGRFHRHEDPSVALGGKFDVALGQGKQRVVSAHADVRPGVPAGATLAHENVAGKNALAAVALDAE